MSPIATPPSDPPGGYQKISVSMPSEIVVAIREKAGRGGVSQFLTEAAEDRLRRTAMIEWLREAEAEAGPPDQEYAAELEDAFARARASMRAATDQAA